MGGASDNNEVEVTDSSGSLANQSKVSANASNSATAVDASAAEKLIFELIAEKEEELEQLKKEEKQLQEDYAAAQTDFDRSQIMEEQKHLQADAYVAAYEHKALSDYGYTESFSDYINNHPRAGGNDFSTAPADFRLDAARRLGPGYMAEATGWLNMLEVGPQDMLGVAGRGPKVFKGLAALFKKGGKKALSKLKKQTERVRSQRSDRTKARKKRRKKRKECQKKGNPVQMPTGMTIAEDAMFLIAGIIPIVIGSIYYSDCQLSTAFGNRRIGMLDAFIERNKNGTLTYWDVENDPVIFPNPTPNPEMWFESDSVRSIQIQQGRRRSLIIREEGKFHYFAKHKSGKWNLVRTEDRNNNTVIFERDEDGHLLTITNVEGLKVRFEHKGKLRIGAWLQGLDGAEKKVMSWGYDDRGNMVKSECLYGDIFDYGYDQNMHMVSMQRNGLYQASYTNDKQGRKLSVATNGPYNGDLFEYDDKLRITTYLPQGNPDFLEKFYYNEFDTITAEANALGHIKRSFENDLGYIEKQVDAEGNETSYTYDDNGNIKSITDGEGRSSFYAWDDDDNLEILIDPEGNSWDYHYDDKGNLIAIEDANRFRSDVRNNDQGLPIGIMRHDGLLQQYAYDEHHRLTVLSDFNGGKTKYEHDEFGRITQITDALGAATQLVYRDQVGWDFWQASKVIRPDGNTIEYVSKKRGVITVIEGDQRHNTYQYDAFGNLLKVCDTIGNELSFHYDGQERIEKITNQNGLDWTFARDGAGRIIRECDFDDQSFEYDYDAADRVIEVRRNDGGRTLYTYDKSDLIVEEAVYVSGSAKPDIVSFEYNDRGLLAKVTNANSMVEYEYNSNGEVVAESTDSFRIESDIDCCGQRSQRRVFDLARADQPESSSALDEGLSALAKMRGDVPVAQVGQLLQQVDYLYDPLGGLKEFKVGGKEGRHAPLKFTRDLLGRELTRASASGFSLAKQWDALGQLQSQQAGRALTGVPDKQGNRIAPNVSMSRQYGWNKFFEPTDIKDQRWGETHFRYDARGQISQGSFSDGFTEQFSYDPAQNVSGVTEQSRPLTKSEGSEKQSGYTLLVQDYRTRKNEQHQTAKELLTWRSTKGGRVELARGTFGERIVLEYDSRGRVTSRLVERDGFRPQRWRFSWDGRDRLDSVIVPSGDKWAYTYDPLGRRLEKIKYSRSLNKNGEQGDWLEVRRISTLWDGDVPAWEEDSGDRVEWHFEPNSFVPLARQQGDQLCYVVTDYLGTPREILSVTGVPVWAADLTTWGQLRRLWQGDNDNNASDRGPFQGYDGDGNPVYSTNVHGNGSLELSGSLALKASAELDPYFCPIRFQGQWADEETGLYYNRFRYYDPRAAQYISPDPIGLIGGMRSNGYVVSPVKWLDPVGLESRLPSWWVGKQGHQGHHIIPWEFRDNPFLKRHGFNINDRANLMHLPMCKGFGTGASPGKNAGTHNGWSGQHSAYNQAVGEEIGQLQEKATREKWSKRCVQIAIRQLQLKYRTMLSTGALSLGPNRCK
ncbi:RHS repeat-associated core domain-containing protein [Pseudovibrio denitrificans]|uniref:RHS repeat-associated core domain-containing protein n=1 Tax=Pseudovibrio denitrificans TaxID=258256 RepID=UPI0039BF5DFD